MKRNSLVYRKDSPGQYPDIALAAGQYMVYCPAKAFDAPAKSGTYIAILFVNCLATDTIRHKILTGVNIDKFPAICQYFPYQNFPFS